VWKREDGEEIDRKAEGIKASLRRSGHGGLWILQEVVGRALATDGSLMVIPSTVECHSQSVTIYPASSRHQLPAG
jgi:hypothetical protein